MNRKPSAVVRPLIRYSVWICAFLLSWGCASALKRGQFSGDSWPANRWPGKAITDDNIIYLPNQWRLRPAGRQIDLGDLPSNVKISPDRRYAAILHCGYLAHEVRIYDLKEEKIISNLDVGRAWFGLGFLSKSNTIVVSGGTDDVLRLIPFKDGVLGEERKIALGMREEAEIAVYPCGFDFTPDEKTAYVAGQRRNQLLRVDIETSKVAKVVTFPQEEAFPYDVALSRDGKTAFVSLWGESAVAAVNLADGRYELIQTDSHPNDLELSRDGKTLFVACSNANTVAVIDTASRKVLEKLHSCMYPNMPAGTTPNGLALSPDEKRLYVANADNNNVAVMDVSRPGHGRVLGHIPTGWYPTSVAVTPDNKTLLVANGKGNSSFANPEGPNPLNRRRGEGRSQYIGGLMKGTLSVIEIPDAEELKEHTGIAYNCAPLRRDLMPTRNPNPGNPIPAKLGDPSPIKYCVYVIKENRTYDQVLGDMPQGNGDPNLCIFGEAVTPNHHAIACEFVLLDNFYVESEVSADGHEWSVGAYATDFVEKTWPVTYGEKARGFPYPAEGIMKYIAQPAGGYIWDRAKEAGLSYRSYGEFVSGGGPDGDATPRSKALEGHFCPYYRTYDLHYKDVDRINAFLEELKEFEKNDDLPRLMVVRLPNDHTAGTRADNWTPIAMVAENDYALGMMLEGLAKSKFWPQMAVFVVEDDAQNGSDHVDCHRTVGLVAGPYVKRNAAVHQLYSTASMLRTMELILGLKPMSQYDAAAAPMYDCFQNEPDVRPYVCKAPQVQLYEMNKEGAYGAERSAEMNLAVEDAIPDVEFNEIIWKSIKGADSPMPPPVRAGFIRPRAGDDDL
ncbi:MAG: beta-propeller fold lactonase family protein [bacterium]